MSDEPTLSVTTESESGTQQLGKKMGLAMPPGFVLALNGTLGAGKTCLSQAIIRALDVETPVVSPTYTLCIPYRGRLDIWHLDAYRINDLTEVDELGLDEAVEGGTALIVEWANRIEEALPPIDLELQILPEGESTRVFHFVPQTPVGKKLATSVVSRTQ